MFPIWACKYKVSLNQQLEILEQTHIIYDNLHLWVEKKQRQKGDLLQPWLFIRSAEREVAFILGNLDPFVLFVQHQSCSSWQGQLSWSSRSSLMCPAMDKSGMYQNSVVSSHLQNILHKTRLSFLIPAPERHAAVSHRSWLLQRPLRALRILPPAISNLCDRNSLALRKMRSH